MIETLMRNGQHDKRRTIANMKHLNRNIMIPNGKLFAFKFNLRWHRRLWTSWKKRFFFSSHEMNHHCVREHFSVSPLIKWKVGRKQNIQLACISILISSKCLPFIITFILSDRVWKKKETERKRKKERTRERDRGKWIELEINWYF